MASTPRLASREAGIFTAGQVIPADVVPSRGPANPSSGNATAVAPAGQRPRAGTAASCTHETTPAGTGLGGCAGKGPSSGNAPAMGGVAGGAGPRGAAWGSRGRGRTGRRRRGGRREGGPQPPPRGGGGAPQGTKKPSAAGPAGRGSTRHARGGLGVVRRATPS